MPAPALPDDALLARSEALLSTSFDEAEVILLHPGRGVYYGLDGVGAAIWQHLEPAPRTVAELLSLLLSRYDVPEAACRRDLEAFVEELRGEGLVEVTRPAP